ncbi:MAG TPA: hypothetical protein PLJ13_17920 [Cyclobacteriaceae bacterium]|nr:hypothetical protein [Cyclobacteriaceae bacterium]HRG79119.1 hypothetical protein [Cyclobacteriaceae bacterium]
MSQAFIREGDEQGLSDIDPTMNALINYLTRENNGIRVYEKETMIDAAGQQIHLMSNGMKYSKDNKGCWIVI